jgi:hypothetical protein
VADAQLLLGLLLSAAVGRCEEWSWPVKTSELVQFQEGKFVLIPGMTYTYIDAIADSGMVRKDRQRLCFPGEMLRTQLYVAVESYFNEHPEGLQRPAALVVMEALQRKWRRCAPAADRRHLRQSCAP